jgi:hypothetical protein
VAEPAPTGSTSGPASSSSRSGEGCLGDRERFGSAYAIGELAESWIAALRCPDLADSNAA